MREQIEDMLVAVVGRDAPRLATIVTRLGATPPQLDQAGLANDLAELVAYHGGKSLEQFNLGRALTDLTEIIRRYEIVLPSAIALLIKVLVMLEGTSRLLQPQFNLIELMAPYQKKMIMRRLSPARHLQKLRRLFNEWEYFGEVLPRSLADLLQSLQSGRFDVHLEHRRLEPSVNRLVLGLLTSALYLGSALLWSMKVPPIIGDVSVFGIVGCGLSFVMGIRLLWAIRKSGHLDQHHDKMTR
jgi:ubiquinone biosynthesis protein